ncbi:hypothetical protein AQUCO_08500010v1 [Aquilegia coerulea]|uniref:Cytochrome P450 n=1 Tax=Aquilegia coerulea TaxID=218851 RepID=A0A2G5C6L4_AQUCA|nr:hypothetical protein AQUCO_08500010v1 [Aquilegia coerulea]
MDLQLMSYFSLFFAFLLLLYMSVKVKRGPETRNQNSKLPPGPWKLPFIGHLHHLLGLPHHSLRDLAKKHGPLMLLQLGEVRMLVVSSPRVAKELMKTHDAAFADRPTLLAAEIFSYNYKGIIFSPYGQYWRQLRKICIQELSSAKKVQSWWPVKEEEVSNLIGKISSLTGSPVDLSEILISLTNDIISREAFGKKCKDKDVFVSLMQEVLRLAGGFDFADLFPSLKFLHGIGGTKLKFLKTHRKVDKILEDIITEHRENRKRIETEKVGYEEDLVDVLLRLQEDDDLAIPIEDTNLKAVILDIFVAGSESSSSTIVWALSEMMRNPRIMEKVQMEVRQILYSKEKVDQSDLNELKYLRSVIKETLRLHPPNVLIPPRTNRERCEIDGYEIPEQTKVIVNAWAIGRDPEFWSNAESFEPERFEDLSIDYRGANFEYIPFGAGRRICPGISLGVANIELALAQLLYHFNWKLPNGVKPAELDMTEVFGAKIWRKSHLILIPTLHV